MGSFARLAWRYCGRGWLSTPTVPKVSRPDAINPLRHEHVLVPQRSCARYVDRDDIEGVLLVWCLSRCGNGGRTRCLWVMSPAWNRFTLPRIRAYEKIYGLSRLKAPTGVSIRFFDDSIFGVLNVLHVSNR